MDFKKRTRQFWTEVSSLQKSGKSCWGTQVIKNRDGVFSKGRNEFLSFWADFWEDLYAGNAEFSSEFKNLDKFELGDFGHPELNIEPSFEELKTVLKSLAKNKSPGLDKVMVNELAVLTRILDPKKNEENLGLIVLHKLILLFWHLEKIPDSLKTLILVPLLKDPDGDHADPGNYRPIALMSNLFKIYQSILNSRISKFVEKNKLLSDLQYGFRPNRSILDAHFVFNDVILKKSMLRGPRGGRNAKAPLFVAYLDIKKAFDSVPRKVLYRKLYKIGIRGKILRVLIDLLTDVKGVCRIDKLMTREFDIKSGVVQGSRLGPILFSLFFDDLVRELNATLPGVQLSSGDIVSAIAYADDIVLMADSPGQLQGLIDICEKWSIKNGIRFAPKKCKIQVFNSNRMKQSDSKHVFKLYEKELEVVKNFKYLGLLLKDSKNQHGQFIKKQLKKAQKRLGVVRLLGFHKDGLCISTGVKLYKLLIRPLLEFGAQIVSYKKTLLYVLEKFQTKALKSLMGLHSCVKSETVRLLAGVEPLSARFAILKLKYFHKLRLGDQSEYLYKITKHHLNNTRFILNSGIVDDEFSESFLASVENFGGELWELLSAYEIPHEFQISSDQNFNEFSSFVKRKVLDLHYEKDLSAFDGNVTQSFVFKKAAMPMLRETKPYPNIFVNSVLFSGQNRVSRTTLLRCLSGAHFASENFCLEFKRQNQKSHKKCSHCSFCGCSDRTLAHFLNCCTEFQKERNQLYESLRELRVDPPENLLDIFALFFIPYDKKHKSELEDISRVFATYLQNISNKLS